MSESRSAPEAAVAGPEVVFNDSGVPLIVRIHRALGPLAGGMILDSVDLLTAGPLGLFAGLLVGMPVGWWISSIYQFSVPSRLLFATLAGVYCTLPATELIPLATIISAIARFFAGDPAGLRQDRDRPPARLETLEPDSPH